MFLCGHCHGNSTFTKRWEGVREQYRIVLSKHPWALTAQAPKIEDEWLHGRSVWTPQVSPRKCPPCPKYEVSCQGYQLDLHCCFACALSRAANSGESCIALESRLTHSLVAKLSQRSLLAFVLQSMLATCKQGYYGWVCVKLWLPDVVAPEGRLQLCTWPQLEKRSNLAWWPVTQRTSRNHKMVKIGRLVLAGTIW